MDKSDTKRRIAQNSIVLYVRMLFTMFINLYATRLVLKNLGVEDYGVYGVVGSIVGFFQIFTNGISSAIQRHMTYEVGRKGGDPNIVFCSSLNIILLLAFFLFIIIELFGYFYLSHGANIPDGRLTAAQLVFHLSVITSIVSFVSIPYNTLVIAHERMTVYAVISFSQAILSCLSAYVLSLWDESHRLFIYGMLMAITSITIRIAYQTYCRKNFAESKYRLIIDGKTLRRIGKYTGIVTLSGGIQVFVNQCIILLINLLYGVTINAVYMIGRQVEMAFMSFGLNVHRAISPQIIKTYANKDYEVHRRLVYTGSKMGVFMIMLVMIPFVARTEQILSLWLGNVPEYTVSFVRWSIIISIFYSFINPVVDSVRASNNIAAFFLIPDIIYLTTLPVIYATFLLGYNAVSVMMVIVIVQLIMLIIKLIVACRVTIVDFKSILNIVLLPCIGVCLVSMLVCNILSFFLPETIWGLFQLLIFNSLLFFFFIYVFGLHEQERKMISLLVLKVKNLFVKE